jgi:serine/threonine-protein kinase
LPKQGDVLDGKYRVDRVLGEGGMGVVYEAFHLRLRQRVAIKVLRPLIVAQPEFAARFEREARAAATLESPNVAKVLDVDTTDAGLAYMVIEYLEGNDLGEELARRGRLPIQEAVAYVMEACVPIAEAHAFGIIHRDLKPSNLFLAKKGSERMLKLLDFGISKVLAETDAKNTFGTLGTPHYMSPEHVRNASDVDRRSDIWSLGVILYELLTGTEPYAGDPARVIAAIITDPVPPPRTKRDDIPPELEAVIMRALAKDPRDRFPDVRALSVALSPFAPETELVPLTPSARMRLARSVPPPAMHKSDAPVALSGAANPRDVPTMVAPKPRRARWIVSLAAVFVFVVGVMSWWGLRASASVAEPAASSPPPRETATERAAPPPNVEETKHVEAPIATATATAIAPASSSARHAITKPATSASTKRAENPLTL